MLLGFATIKSILNVAIRRLNFPAERGFTKSDAIAGPRNPNLLCDIELPGPQSTARSMLGAASDVGVKRYFRFEHLGCKIGHLRGSLLDPTGNPRAHPADGLAMTPMRSVFRPTGFYRIGSAAFSSAQSDDRRTRCLGSMRTSPIRLGAGPSRAQSRVASGRAYPRVGFIVTNLSHLADRVVAF